MYTYVACIQLVMFQTFAASKLTNYEQLVIPINLQPKCLLIDQLSSCLRKPEGELNTPEHLNDSTCTGISRRLDEKIP